MTLDPEPRALALCGISLVAPGCPFRVNVIAGLAASEWDTQEVAGPCGQDSECRDGKSRSDAVRHDCTFIIKLRIPDRRRRPECDRLIGGSRRRHGLPGR